MQSQNKLKSRPSHVAIIMDGNNRWAKRNNISGVSGHQQGVERAREAVEFAVKKNLDALTLFAFSSENWGRKNEEVDLLMKLLSHALEEQVPNLIKNKVQLTFVGDLDKFDDNLRESIFKAEELTLCNENKNLDLIIAASYGGRWDIVEAAKKIKNLDEEIEINEEIFGSFTSLSCFSDPDLCIRTGGEFRLSNFLLWHLAYSELYFSDFLWPDFDSYQFQLALDEYSVRSRKFGIDSSFDKTK